MLNEVQKENKIMNPPLIIDVNYGVKHDSTDNVIYKPECKPTRKPECKPMRTRNNPNRVYFSNSIFNIIQSDIIIIKNNYNDISLAFDVAIENGFKKLYVEVAYDNKPIIYTDNFLKIFKGVYKFHTKFKNTLMISTTINDALNHFNSAILSGCTKLYVTVV